MPASEAQIRANQANALRSSGPKTPERKERSRANALKHGLTGAGVVLPEADAAEVERKAAAYARELNVDGELGLDLARRAALNTVRMDRAADQQTAALSERVRKAEAEFVAPEGADEDEAARLRAEAGRRAMFDPSKEASLARKYEAAAERNFFRALKELRQLEKQATVAKPAVSEETYRTTLGSFLDLDKLAAEMEARSPEPAPRPVAKPSNPLEPAFFPPIGGVSEIPITIGRRR